LRLLLSGAGARPRPPLARDVGRNPLREHAGGFSYDSQIR
jgi:hypothetical protein